MKIFKMDLQTRKIVFVQNFLKLQNEEEITQFEDLLKSKKLVVKNIKDLKPMSLKTLNLRIDKSEEDFKNGNFKSSSELLKKYI